MQSVYTWEYLGNKLSFRSVADVLIHAITPEFFVTSFKLTTKPKKVVSDFLEGNKTFLNPLSYFLSSLVFLFILTYLNQLIFPETRDVTAGESEEYLQYLITIPFILIIASFNRFFYRRSKVNFLTNLIIATYIEGQTIIYLTIYFLIIENFKILNEPMTQMFIYVGIIYVNLIVFSYISFQRSFISTFLKATLTIFIALNLVAMMFYFIPTEP
ncbi:DUF3667 domain-containing protein [Reichenbachiella sp. MSK19-1]|uniref:DUF3667 domain-containing protein n=1 Tax=Reichenbachiella sp. MSK19-1 TaxID=1897631 RepID=UPI0011C42A63